MKSKIIRVNVTYPDDLSELQNRYTDAVAMVLMKTLTLDGIGILIEKLEEKINREEIK